MIFLRYPFPCNLKVLQYGQSPVNVDRVKEDIEFYVGCNQFSLLHNGRRLHGEDVIPNNSTVHVTFSLLGGKGGFGSMLRAIGAQIEKTTNREACRDLSGRRLRDINEEQRLKKWIAKEAEREQEKIKRRQARIERLKTKAPHKFFDFEYEKEISELPNRVNDALSEGLQKAKQPKKRLHEKSEAIAVPKKSWIAEDFPVTSSDSDSDETNAAAEGSSSKKLKISPKESSSYDSEISESSQSYPGTSKDCKFIFEESTFSDSKNDSSEETSTDSNKVDLVHLQEEKQTEEVPSKIKSVETEEKMDESAEVNKDTGKKCEAGLETSIDTPYKEPEANDDSSINLLEFQSISELEALGLDRLKSALMDRGLKCGGTLSDRAQRLWQIRELQPSEYPTNLLAKKKK